MTGSLFAADHDILILYFEYICGRKLSVGKLGFNKVVDEIKGKFIWSPLQGRKGKFITIFSIRIELPSFCSHG